MNSSLWKKMGVTIVCIFALIGFVLTAGYVAIRLGWTNAAGVIDNQRQAFLTLEQTANVANSLGTTTPDWTHTPQWQTLSAAIVKDQGTIDRAAAAAGVPPRMIVEDLVAEQMRFFFDDRTSYEKFFAPLKILGSETQFSWGVMGVKETTAIEIENNLAPSAEGSTSPFYLGPEYAHMLDTVSGNRFAFLTDQHDHYYSYLYAGLYLHEIEQQWQTAGYDISNRPDIMATLYDVGFANSIPKPNPQSGGAAFQIDGTMWSFGSLAASFYNSNELINEFPR